MLLPCGQHSLLEVWVPGRIEIRERIPWSARKREDDAERVVGLNASVIQSRRGDEENFLSTVWTIQVIRGVAIWVGTILAAVPLALFYGTDELTWMIPLVGFTAVISGFNSTAVLSLRRRIEIRSLVICDIDAQCVALLVTIG